jgi:hypothetical protein
VRVNKTTGYILKADRQVLQSLGTRALRNILVPGNVVTDVYCIINATDNILSTQTVNCTVYVIPLGKIVAIPTTITYLNPSLIAVG